MGKQHQIAGPTPGTAPAQESAAEPEAGGPMTPERAAALQGSLGNGFVALLAASPPAPGRVLPFGPLGGARRAGRGAHPAADPSARRSGRRRRLAPGLIGQDRQRRRRSDAAHAAARRPGLDLADACRAMAGDGLVAQPPVME